MSLTVKLCSAYSLMLTQIVVLLKNIIWPDYSYIVYKNKHTFTLAPNVSHIENDFILKPKILPGCEAS